MQVRISEPNSGIDEKDLLNTVQMLRQEMTPARIFRAIDIDKNGVVSRAKLKQYLRHPDHRELTMGLPPSELFADLVCDHNGYLRSKEFARWWLHHRRARRWEGLCQCFQAKHAQDVAARDVVKAMNMVVDQAWELGQGLQVRNIRFTWPSP